VTPGPVSVKVDPVMVVASIGWLKVAVIFWLVATLTARLAGSVDTTVGLVVLETALVTKVHTKLLASATPPTLLTPVVIVPVKVVLAGSKLVGVKVAILLVAS